MLMDSVRGADGIWTEGPNRYMGKDSVTKKKKVILLKIHKGKNLVTKFSISKIIQTTNP